MKRFIWGFLVIALVGSTWLYFKLSYASVEDQAQDIVKIEIGSIQSVVTAQGTLEPKDYVDVGAQVSGEVIKMHVEIGDSVKIGDLIAEIDPDVYEAQVKSSKAQLKILDAQKTEQQALVMQAERKYKRNKTLYADRAVSLEVMEDAEIDMDVSRAKLLALVAQIEQAESAMDEDITNLNYTKIYAPMDGTVVDQSVEEGETINANQTTPTIVQIANLDIMTAKAEVAEADIMKLSKGTSMYFTTLGSGERRWEGKTRQILPTPEEINDVVLYNVLADVSNDDYVLLPGMTTQMFFVLASEYDVPLIPVSALGKPLKEQNTDNSKAFEINVLGPTGNELRVVHVGLMDRSMAAVLNGIDVGESVLLKVEEETTERERGGPPMRL